MKTYSGILIRIDMGAGGWQLQTANGIFNLFGPIPTELANKKVVVQGKPTESMGFLMNNQPAIEVHSVKPAS